MIVKNFLGAVFLGKTKVFGRTSSNWKEARTVYALISWIRRVQ